MQLFIAAFENVPDPRAESTRHDLVELLIIAFIAVLCGARSCSEMAEFGREKINGEAQTSRLERRVHAEATQSNAITLR